MDDEHEKCWDPNPSPSSAKHGVSEPLISMLQKNQNQYYIGDTITMQISLGRYVLSPSTGRKESKNLGGIGLWQDYNTITTDS